ncbi:DBH-like monooxygenase protein 1 like [Pseudolycoriella hygida]|uniref:DBH-like monooxygenase protein 1 like n=1 Tax=Pseudolycoriella hygida TaxID=35572 RepID=A0A9Q0N5W8_9DIPT|nr:DBH-like monooxygenase protein 1 like [Pseudolycoriella hygida]
MDSKLKVVVLLSLFGLTVASIADFVGKNSIGKRQEYLDSNGRYLVEWEAYTDTQTIIFDLTVATSGFVGFGISPVGGMTGADIIIGGVHPNSSVYFSNRHGIGNVVPVVDDNETWELLEASENATHTHLKVGRQLNTCDSQDVVIGNSTNNFIWAIGQDDNISYHRENRGTSANLILDPPLPPVDTSSFERWRMTHTMEMPAKKTTYWCTVQKSPPLPTKHHIVGFRPILDTPDALKYTHHFIVHKCRAPEGSTDEETFEHYLNRTGDECYGGVRDVPMDYCESYLFLWAVGGKMVLYPEHVGYPFAVDGQTNYYLLEVHFDNPNSLPGITFESGLEIFYTSELR